MRDILPAEKSFREQLLAIVRATYISRGFQEIETPALEDLSKLTSGQGGDNEKLVFQVLKRGEELEQAQAAGASLADLGLRFDLTVPLTRYYASNHSKLPRVLKALQVGPVWRAERPQKGRYRQFLQCDIDIIGDATMLAEAELLSASLSALEAVGLKDATIRLNHRQLLAENIAGLGVASENALKAMIIIDKLDKIGVAGVRTELEQAFGPEVAAAGHSWLSSLDQTEFPEALKPLVEALSDLGPRLRYDASLVRGMGYYTGAIFEIEHPAATSSIGGGGRYDSMVGKWLGAEVPAVGISLGIERIIELAKLPEIETQNTVLLIESEAQAVLALKLQAELIESGSSCRIEIRQKNIKAQLSNLATQGFDSFASVGDGIKSVSELDIRKLD
jgi:histidyl-tRNA synthetase